MLKEIDFLKAHKEIDFKKLRLLRFLQVGSIVTLIIYCLLGGTIFSLWVYQQQKNQEITTQSLAKKKRIGELKKVDSLQTLLKQRLSLVSKLFTQKRVNYFQFFSLFKNLVSEGVELTEVKFSENGEVVISGKAKNAFVLSNFLEKLTSSETSNIFSTVLLSSINRQKDGSYSFNLSFQVNEKS